MSIIITRTLDNELYNLDTLVEEIEEGVSKYISIQTYNYDSHLIDIEVDDLWASPDDIELDGVISAHVNEPDLDNTNTIPHSIAFGGGVNPYVGESTTMWSTVGYFMHPGSNNSGVHTRCRIIWTTSAAVTQADIRILHRRPVLTVVCSELDKSPAVADEYETLFMGVVIGIPKKPTMFEVQVRGNADGVGNRIKIAGLQFL